MAMCMRRALLHGIALRWPRCCSCRPSEVSAQHCWTPPAAALLLPKPSLKPACPLDTARHLPGVAAEGAAPFTPFGQSETFMILEQILLVNHQLDHHHPFLRAGPDPASVALPAGAAPAGEVGAGAATAGRMAVGGGSRLAATLAALRLSSSSMRFLIFSKSCSAQHAKHPCNNSQASSAASLNCFRFNTFHLSMAPCPARMQAARQQALAWTPTTLLTPGNTPACHCLPWRYRSRCTGVCTTWTTIITVLVPLQTQGV